MGSFLRLKDIDRNEEQAQELIFKQQNILSDWNNLSKKLNDLIARHKPKEARTLIADMLWANPNDVAIQKTSATIDALIKDDEQREAQKKLEEEKAKREQAQKSKIKRQQIKELVDQYTAGLSTSDGETHEDLENGLIVSCVNTSYTYETRWLNPEKTKAKVVVTQHAHWTGAISGRPNFSRVMDYDAGSFICEEETDGVWHTAQ